MPENLETDICVIGAGSAGLSVAAGAVQMGARTVLIEKGRMGGECLNYGCVPSKSMLVAGRAARAGRLAARMGIDYDPPRIDYGKVRLHVQGVIGAIEPNDSQERFEGLGVTVLRDAARFTGPREVAAGDKLIRARRFVVATGSRPMVPPIPGLDRVRYLTNETVFELDVLPRHLIVIGGGPIGCELGQAFRDLGAQVSIVEMAKIMPKDDPELVDVVRRRLTDHGVKLLETCKVAGVESSGEGVTAVLERDGETLRLEGSHLLLAAGRQPNVESLQLESAGVDYDRRGISTDDRLRTSNPKIYAAGDVAGGYQFTHMAGHHAGVVIKNALFRLPGKVERTAVPWVTFTDPELAQVGLTESMAREAGLTFKVLRWPFAENDRAQAEHETEGLAKLIVGKGGKILGAGIVGPAAGELIHPWVLAMANKLKIGAMAQYIAPYPTLGEVSKRAAGAYYTPKLFSARTRFLVRALLKLG